MSKDLGGMLSGIGNGIEKFGTFANNGGLLGKLLGNKDGPMGLANEINPGMKMFGMDGSSSEGPEGNDNSFLDRFLMQAMRGFMGQ